MARAPVIAIDGPSASGKGTVAARVAARLGFHLLDSGALYRVVALAGLRAGLGLDDESGLARIAASLPLTFEGERVLLGGEDVALAIRAEDVSAGASRVAALPAVRAALLERQRAFCQPPGLVADGRDMGSVVFPDATVKVFLTASAEARAGRRHQQLIEKGLPATLAGLLQDLRERDARDAMRSVAPLARCADAALVDTTDMTIEQAVEAVLGLARDGLAGRSGNSGVAPPNK
jgi:3-phosphoshikimate 1-carboxyvinyltransferase